ncbi:MAG: DUF6444 domain-containing protein [Mycobacteriales bacterium]
MPDQPNLSGAAGRQAGLVARLRALVEAKGVEIAGLHAEIAELHAVVDTARSDLAAERELRRRLELRIAELERRLGQDSSNSGTPPSKEPIGVKERRQRERQSSERERRKDRKPGGQVRASG